MGRTGLSLLFIFISLHTLMAQPVFNRLYGRPGIDKAHHMMLDTAGNLWVTGHIQSSYFGSEDLFLAKFDTSGNLLWNKVLGDWNQDLIYHFIPTRDGGLMLAGNSESVGAGNDDFILVKLDSAMNTTWSTAYGGNNMDLGFCVQETWDTGYVCAATTPSWGIGGQDWYIFKVNRDGNLIWSKALGGPNTEFCYWIEETSDTNLISCGTYSPQQGSLDARILKMDRDGNVLWSKEIGGASFESLSEIKETASGDYVTVGYTQSFGQGGMDGLMIRTDKDGNIKWFRTYGSTNTDQFESVIELRDGNLMALGSTWGFGAGSRDYWLVKTDPDGNLLWSAVYGSSGNDLALAIMERKDGSLVFTGESDFGNDEKDILITQTDPNGYVNCNGFYVDPVVMDHIPNVTDTVLFFIQPQDSITPFTYNDTTTFFFTDSTVCACTPPPVQTTFTWINDSAGNVAFNDASVYADSLRWDFGDGSTSDATKPVHNYAQTGSYFVCLVAYNECNSDTACDTVQVYITGLAEPSGTESIRPYPNPTAGTVTVEVPEELVSTEWYLQDITGRKVAPGVILLPGKNSLDYHHLPAGLYIYEMVTPEGLRITGRLFLQ